MIADLTTDKKLWDRFIDSSPSGLLFHKWDFLNIIEKHTGYKFLPYGVYQGEELMCIFPLFYKNYYGLKLLFSPPPRVCLPYLGFVMGPGYEGLKQRKKEHYLNSAVEAIDKEITRLSANYVSILSAPSHLDARPFKWNKFDVDMNYTYAIDLDWELCDIWDGFSKDCRQRIKLVEKMHASLKESQDIDRFYSIMNSTYGDQGLNSPLISPDYLKDIMAAFPENIKIYYLYVEGQITDAELVYSYKDDVKLWLGGMTIQKNIQGTQEFSTWELIKKAKSEERKELEIVGANIKRLCEYQSKFNPSLRLFLSIKRKSVQGRMAEFFYKNMIQKKKVSGIL